MGKITRDKLSNLISWTYTQSNNGYDFGDTDDVVIQNMIIVHSYVISHIVDRIRRTRRMINITEAIGAILILVAIICKAIPLMVLESLIYTTITVILFDIFYKLRIHNYLKDAQKYIYSNFHINYSYKQAWEIMRVKLGFNYGKPFLKYKERPENYKEEFKKN